MIDTLCCEFENRTRPRRWNVRIDECVIKSRSARSCDHASFIGRPVRPIACHAYTVLGLGAEAFCKRPCWAAGAFLGTVANDFAGKIARRLLLAGERVVNGLLFSSAVLRLSAGDLSV